MTIALLKNYRRKIKTNVALTMMEVTPKRRTTLASIFLIKNVNKTAVNFPDICFT